MKLTRKKLIIISLTAVFVMAGVLSFCKYGLAEDTVPAFKPTYQWSGGVNPGAGAGSPAPIVSEPISGSGGGILSGSAAGGTGPLGFVDQNTLPFANDAVNIFSTAWQQDWGYLGYKLGITDASALEQPTIYDLANIKIDAMNAATVRDAATRANIPEGPQRDAALAESAKNLADTTARLDKEATKLKDPPIMEIIGNIFAWLLYWVVFGISWIIAREVDLLISVMSYPININMPAVNAGWAVIRDLCNNFFIVILLAIAVGTVFRLPSYRYKEALPKLLVAAVLINFSKMITGIAIDISQIIMLTFAVPLAGGVVLLAMF